MTFLLGGANSASGGYEVSNSLRFDGSSSFLRDTLGTPTSQKKFTFSCWAKGYFQRSGSVGSRLCSAGANGDAHYTGILHMVRTNGTPQIYISDSAGKYVNFNNTFLRDPSAWYHFVVAIDTTQGTATNRTKLYINGTQLSNTVASHEEQPTENYDWPTLASGQLITIGANSQSDASFYDGYMADVHFIDGQAKAPTDFGEFDNSGIWKPIEYAGTFGNNGFKLEFKQTGTSTNSSGIGADTSGNDIHLAVTGLAATDVTVDTPTNNFATMNPVHVSSYGSAALPTFSEGNLKIGMNSDSSTSSTIAPSKGKWYVEYKQSENTADNQGYPIVGISATLGGTGGDVIGFRTPSGTDYRGQLGTTSVSNAFGSARSADDIFGFYINLDDDILIVHKNGSDYMGSGASSGLDWSGGLTTTNEQTGFYHFYVQNNSDGSPRYTDEVNFGNPTFSISSSNSDANGYGSFEYSPTLSGTAFYAMCTKNLAEFG